MSAKQDRQGVRTAAQLEQKWNFGDSFAEVMGIATDAQKTAHEAEQIASNPSANLTRDEVFNLLTDNGAWQGIYRDENGELYINASYLRSGVLVSADGKIQIDLSNNSTGVPVFNTGISTNGLLVRGDQNNAPKLLTATVETDGYLQFANMRLWDREQNVLVEMTEDYDRTGGVINVNSNTIHNDVAANKVVIEATSETAGVSFLDDGFRKGFVGINANNEGVVDVDRVDCSIFDGKRIFWQQQPDGTYLLMGWDVEE